MVIDFTAKRYDRRNASAGVEAHEEIREWLRRSISAVYRVREPFVDRKNATHYFVDINLRSGLDLKQFDSDAWYELCKKHSFRFGFETATGEVFCARLLEIVKNDFGVAMTLGLDDVEELKKYFPRPIKDVIYIRLWMYELNTEINNVPLSAV